MTQCHTVDVHVHIAVPEIFRDAAPGEAWRPRLVEEAPPGRPLIEYGGQRFGSITREFVDADRILSELEADGIDGAVFSPWVALMRYDAPAAEGLASCRVQNDALAALARRRPDRIAGLGLVPLQDPALAVAELERLVAAGLKGVEIGTNINGVYLGDPRFRPFWERCEALGALVFIHPVDGGMRSLLRDYYMSNVVGNPVETAITAAHLVFGGVLEDYPNLKMLLAHGGGALTWLRGRLDRGFRVRPEIESAIPRPPSEYIKRFYVDTITHDPVWLRALVEYLGADRVLLGSDYPFDMCDPDPIGTVGGADLGSEATAKVLGENARRLFE